MRRLALALVLVAFPAFAQQPQEYTLKVTADELNTLAKALMELPWREANPIINKLQQQIAPQRVPPDPKPADK